MPRFGHLPYVMGEGNKKLSKRDPESNLFHHRDRGFIPEGLVNYLALLGWGFSADRDVFSRDELVAAFDVENVNPNPARFDLKKAEAINGDHIRQLDVGEFAARTVPYLQAVRRRRDADHAPARRRSSSRPRRSCRSASACSARRPACSASSSPMPRARVRRRRPRRPPRRRRLGARRRPRRARPAARRRRGRTTEIEEALRGALIDGLGLKPRVAFGPVRTAISGRRVSPPLFESMQILGKVDSLARIDRLAALIG